MNPAYTELLERQARRGLGLLPDRAGDVERNQRDFERRQILAGDFGDWVAKSLGPWDWFINPISFRDRHPDLERNPKTGAPRQYRSTGCVGPVKIFAPDPRLKSWEPCFRGRRGAAPPVPDKALVEIKDFLLEAAGIRRTTDSLDDCGRNSEASAGATTVTGWLQVSAICDAMSGGRSGIRTIWENENFCCSTPRSVELSMRQNMQRSNPVHFTLEDPLLVRDSRLCCVRVH